jgi:exonuclease SbcC
MIKSIQIKNFQSHKDTSLEFDPGVNIIVGSTDSGKTAIIRALILAVWNRPQGEAYRSHWGGSTEVIITTSEGNQITRRRTNSENVYIIADFGTLEALRTGVPVEVSTLLNMNEINIQQQLDQPFLISATSGEVAKHFNEVANLELIDTARSNVESWLRSFEQDFKAEEHNLERYQSDLQRYDYLDKLEIDIEVLEGMEERLHQMESTYNNLSETTVNIERLSLDIEKESKLLELSESVELVYNLIERRDAVDSQYSTLRAIISDHTITNNQLHEAKSSLTNIQKEFEQKFPDICPLCGQQVTKKHIHEKNSK